MATDQQIGSTNIRQSYYDKTVKGFAEATYKFKQAVNESPTSAWINYFFRESSTALTTTGTGVSRDIPRGADFPRAVVQWDRIRSDIEKYGMEDFIFWEDILADDVPAQERTLFRIAEAVAKKVDDTIWDGLTESRVATNIQSVAITAGLCWDTASAAVMDDLLQAKQKIAEYNYPVESLVLFVSPKGYRDMLNYLYQKGAQAPSMGNQVAQNGVQGTIAGITVVVSNSVTASYALVVVPKRCATWKALVPLQTTTIEDPYKGVKVRSVEEGILQLTDPKAVVLISNTDSP